jgi:hypothetical protein
VRRHSEAAILERDRFTQRFHFGAQRVHRRRIAVRSLGRDRCRGIATATPATFPFPLRTAFGMDLRVPISAGAR